MSQLSRAELEEIAIADTKKVLSHIDLKVNLSLREEKIVDKSTNKVWNNIWKIRLDTIEDEPLFMYYLDPINGEIIQRSEFSKVQELLNSK